MAISMIYSNVVSSIPHSSLIFSFLPGKFSFLPTCFFEGEENFPCYNVTTLTPMSEIFIKLGKIYLNENIFGVSKNF
jgi:hypothetical protein